ncbi:MAG: serine/threonine-protein kinase [Polyangiaceae bacterium]
MAAPPLPDRIGRYEVVGRLAAGGMAEILLSRLIGPSGFERPVVVKRILPHLAHTSEFSTMFLDEARLVARIRHPNVVQVHELGEIDEELFLVMEYLEGESVSGLLRRFVSLNKRMPHALCAYIIAEACAGLHAAHELTDSEGYPLDLVHRDISPQNVFVLYNGGVRLLDFGIAKAADRSSQTATGEIKGKFQYMSPEQCLCKPLDRRSDIFSLGVVLFELSTNRRLFKRENELMVFKAICEQPLVPPSQVAPGYPKALEAVVVKALARRPEDRYQTAAEMRKDLLAVARELGAGDEPAEHVAQLMRDVFRDRIEEKAEMLRRVSSGSNPTRIPVNNADEGIEVPDVTEWVSSKRLSAADPAPPSKTPRRVALGVVLGLATLGVGYVAISQTRSSEAEAARPEPSAAPSSAAPAPPARDSVSAGPTPAPAVPSTVTLTVSSNPPGANVYWDGDKRGTTPVTLTLTHSATAGVLKVERVGYDVIEKTLVPDQARAVDLALVRAARARPNPTPEPAPKPKEEVPLF